MSKRPSQLIIFGQVMLYLSLAVCIALKPHYLNGDAGISNYGIHRLVFIPYTVGFLASGLFTIAAARLISPNTTYRKYVTFLYLVGGLLLVLLISTYPYQHSQFLTDLHIAIGGLLFIAELIFSIWLVRNVYRGPLWLGLLGLQIIGCIFILLSLQGTLRLLLAGQAIAGISFGILLSLASLRLQAVKEPPK
jgi:hypothetical protein